MIKARVPATSANMGPGFDCLGVAVQLYNVFGFEETSEGLTFEGFPEEFCNSDNIVYQAMMKCFEKGGYTPKGLKIYALDQDVPVSRGLGSSSTCIVGGLVGANKIMGNKLSTDEILEMAVEIEGHPDNVAPALLGGMVVAVQENGKVYYEKVKVHENIKFIPIIPNFRLSTKDARNVLPKTITLKEGVYNVSRAALLVAAMTTGKNELFKYTCEDAFHQNYRSKLIEGFDKVKEETYKLNAMATYLSGAGPTIMSLISSDNYDFVEKLKIFLNEEELHWDVHELSIDKEGALIIEGE